MSGVIKTTTKIGVKGFDVGILARGGFCEVSLSELGEIPYDHISGCSGKLVVRCGLRELKQDCWDELAERTGQITPLAVIWSLPPQFQLWASLDDLAADIDCNSSAPDHHYIDAPFSLKGLWPKVQMIVCDPLAPRHMKLAQSMRRSKFWRIHGWHPDRWVRRYSQMQIEDLVRAIWKYRPQFVTLAHSQRLDQWLELESALKRFLQVSQKN